jgi:diguanylate cyclase (GGDEF)-like protein/PAS domain S-box-containing protein
VTSRRHVLAGYFIWVVLLVAAYYGLPSLRVEAWGLIGLSGVAGIVAGVVINRPARKAPWLLLAAANLSFTAGQVSFLVLTQIMGAKVPFPSFADVLYLVTYPLYAAGLLIFIWCRTPDRDRRSLIDALTLTVGLALLSWIYLVLPYVHNPELSWVQKSVAISYPLGDVLTLAMIARLLAPGTARTRSVYLLTLGTVGMLASDASFGLLQLHGSFHSGTIVDLGWAVFYGAWGAAALHPSMSELTRPASGQQAEASPVRLAVLLLASLIAPTVLFTQSLARRYHDDSVIAVFSAILYLLVLSRLWDVAASHRRAYFRTLMQDASDAILIIGDDGKVRYATPSATSIFGDIGVEGACLWDLVKDSERDDVARALTRMREHVGRTSYCADMQITRRDDVGVQVQVRCSDLRGDCTVGGLVLTLRDVTAQRQLEDELKHRAFHDALTGLPNRVLFQDRAAGGLARTQRDGTTAGVLFVDLDDFKVVNDTMGHSVGDELLVAAGIRLSAVVRDSDTVARLGGDEFALLIENVADSAAVDAFAGRIVQAFGEPFALADGSVVSTATVGVATTEDSADVDELLRHADLALYAAKAAGKRQWRRYLPVLSAGMVRRREGQAALDEAVKNSAFTLAYQPIVALTDGEMAGFEALVRWRHPQWGMMQPGQFIELAEETGHIVPLGSWVLGQAAMDVVQWAGHAPCQPPPYVSVNVSASQFRDPGFVDGVRRVLAESGLTPSALMLELTESVLLRRDERIHSDLMELKAIGVELAIDDFGTGYSSLSYLRELPIDVLKIDKSFVDGIGISEQRLALVEGIIRIARTLNLKVIAEGIETEIQRDLLVSMGCQFGQGYLLAMPVEADQAEALVRIGRGLVPELPRVSH